MRFVNELSKALRTLQVSKLQREYGQSVVLAHFKQDPFCKRKWHVSEADNPDIEFWETGVHEDDFGIRRFGRFMDSIVTLELAPPSGGRDAKRVPDSESS